MADADLIALLNGEQASPSLFGRDEEDRALLDEDGLPNDKFLEAVKAELTSFENRRKNEIYLRESGSGSRGSFRKAGKKSDDDEYFRSGLHRPEYDSNEDVDAADKDDESDDSSYRPDRSAFSDDDDDDDDYEDEDVSIDKAKKLFTKRVIKSGPRSRVSRGDEKANKKIKSGVKRSKMTSSASSVRTTKSKSSLVPAAATRQSIRGNRSPLRKSDDKGDDDKENNNKQRNDNEMFNAEMEAKLSTCMLRIRGLLHTIKSLEGKLVASNIEVEDKAAQLKSVQRKIHAIECKEKIRYQGRSRDEYATLVSQLEQQLAKTRKLQEQTHSKLIEEKRLRNNADERCKSLRQNGERQKATINDLQSNLKLNKQELSDLQQKAQRARSEHKSITTEAHTLRETLGGAEVEYNRLKSKNTEQSNEIRMLKNENDSLREDNRKVKHELFAAQDRIRHMSLEVEVARERENTRKTEHRFQNRRLQKQSFSTGESVMNSREDESTDADAAVEPYARNVDWDSDSNVPINTTMKSYGSTSPGNSIIAKGIAESNRRANSAKSGMTTPVHSSWVAKKPNLRTMGFSSSSSSSSTKTGGNRIASPARPPLANTRGRGSDNTDRPMESRGRARDEYDDDDDDENNTSDGDDDDVNETMRSSMSSLPPPPTSATPLPARAHSLSPFRRNIDNNGSTGVSLLAPPSPTGSDVSGRYSRLQKMYERVTAKEQSRDTGGGSVRSSFD